MDNSDDSGARNERRLSFAEASLKSDFAAVHGTVDLLMSKLNLKWYEQNDKERNEGYYIERSEECWLFPDRQARLYVKGIDVGVFGIVHPDVLTKFNIKTFVCLAELNFQKIVDLVEKKVLLA